MPVRIVPPSESDTLLAVLCDAFFDYPVMRYVLGPEPNYAERLGTLVGLFVAARVAGEDLMLSLDDDVGTPVAAALVNLPGGSVPGPAFESLRASVWAELGQEERRRYEAFGAATQPFEIGEPHHHLGMIGVRTAHQGAGHARILLQHVHAVAAADSDSAGVSLTTELSRNVGFYEYFGYELSGYARVAPELETWSFFRPATAADRR